MQLGLLRTQEDFHEHELEARLLPPPPRAHPPPRPWDARTAYQAQPVLTYLLQIYFRTSLRAISLTYL